MGETGLAYLPLGGEEVVTGARGTTSGARKRPTHGSRGGASVTSQLASPGTALWFRGLSRRECPCRSFRDMRLPEGSRPFRATIS